MEARRMKLKGSRIHDHRRKEVVHPSRNGRNPSRSVQGWSSPSNSQGYIITFITCIIIALGAARDISRKQNDYEELNTTGALNRKKKVARPLGRRHKRMDKRRKGKSLTVLYDKYNTSLTRQREASQPIETAASAICAWPRHGDPMRLAQDDSR